VSEDHAPARAGWYPVPQEVGRPRLRYWDGAAWTGPERRGSSGGRHPRDGLGIVALILLVAGFLGTIAALIAFSYASTVVSYPGTVFTSVMLVVLAATPAALVVSIVGLVRGHGMKFVAPVSLASLIIATLGTVLLALPIALYVTGVWILPHI
jgi:Protein of unknown function (DUF2510)